RLRPGFWRGPVDGDGGGRRSRARRRTHGIALHTLPLAAGPHLCRKDALGDAQQVRRSRRSTCSADDGGRRRQAMTTAVDVKEGTATQPDQETPPCAMVIFGGSGDLTKRKLIPALYNLLTSRLLRKDFAVMSIARSEISTDDFRAKMEQEARE